MSTRNRQLNVLFDMKHHVGSLSANPPLYQLLQSIHTLDLFRGPCFRERCESRASSVNWPIVAKVLLLFLAKDSLDSLPLWSG